MTLIDVTAGESQFVDHLAPVYLALPPQYRGDFIVMSSLRSRVQAYGIDGLARIDHPERPILVASYGDHKRARRQGRKRIARAEHGAGQSYFGDMRFGGNASYAGGRDNHDASLFLCPNEYSADKWRTAYPNADVQVVGCPKLDTLPAREGGTRYFTSVQCDPWNDLLAAIRDRPTTPTSPSRMCVAHAIADVKLSEPSSSAYPATAPNPSTTASDISGVDLTLPSDQLSRAREATALVRSAMSTCTTDSRNSCPASATSADRPLDLRWLSDGTLQRSIGGSAGTGSHFLSIQTTTFGSVSLAIPCTTAKAISPATSTTGERPVLCTSFHFNIPLIPETFWTWPTYRTALPALAERFTLIAHAHPKALGFIERYYRRFNIEVVPDFAQVCKRADLYIADNTSTLFEFASTGRPVVVLNSPDFRRDTHHGGRFWDWATVGYQCDRPEDLISTVERALLDPPEQQAERERVLGLVYAHRTGAAQRAADALLSWAGVVREAAA